MKRLFNALRNCDSPVTPPSLGLGSQCERSEAMTNGFTLAEVLITLAIIGIVAALTIPTLVSNYQKKQYVTGLQKSISQISQTFKLILADEGVDSLLQTSVFQAIDNTNVNATYMSGNQSKFATELGKYMKISKACVNPNYDEPDPDCTSPIYKDLLGNDNDNSYTKYGRVKLYMPDGMVYFIKAGKKTLWIQNNVVAQIEVDVNGDKGPNILGRDCFSYILLDNGQVILPGSKFAYENEYGYFHWSEEFHIDTCLSGDYCAARIFEQGWKMDY